MSTLPEAIAEEKKSLSLFGCLGLVVRTWKHGCLLCDAVRALLAHALRGRSDRLENQDAQRFTQSRFLGLLETMCELCEELNENLGNVPLDIVTKIQLGARIDVRLTQDELGRVGLSCHYALDCLCDNWKLF